MSPLQALAFFIREATLSLRRSWKVSLLAVFTIAVSLFIGGLFLLLTGNLARIVAEWRSEAKAVVYLADGVAPETVEELAASVRARPWVRGVAEVSAEAAEERFEAAFPQLSQLLSGWERGPLPASLEVGIDPRGAEGPEVRRWLEDLRTHPAVAMVDDDRQWLRQVETLIAVLRGSGLVLGGVLLAAAIFTIASVVRLTAYLYREEIAVLRLVGATEFIVRGPFFVEGFVQGLGGGLLAVAALFAAYELAVTQALPTILGSVLLSGFLPPAELLALVALGGLAGLFGAFISMRREEERAEA